MNNFATMAVGTTVFTVVTFPLAVIWHVILLDELYDRFGYFEGEPGFAIGLLSILIQGAVLSFLVARIKLAGNIFSQCLKASLLIGVFFWTSHVLAFIAKQIVTDAPLFVLVETGFLLIQFDVYGVLMGLVLSRQSSKDLSNN